MDLESLPRFASVLPIALAISLAASCASAADAAKTLVVEAGKRARANVPMSVAVPDGATKAKMMDGAREVPCQVADGKLWWVLDELPADGTKTYTVRFGTESSADPKGVELKETKETVEVTIDGLAFTTYHFTNPKIGPVQLRRPYFWPVLGPDQTPMTRPWPCTESNLPANLQKDHPHHTSLWVAYGEVGGVDNWSNGDKTGWQIHKGFQTLAGGAVVGSFRQTLDWTGPDRKPNLAEVRTARVYRLPPNGRMIDLEIAFQAKYGKVTFGDTKEGGIVSTRMRSEFVSEKNFPGRLVNAEGLVGAPAWGKRSQWCDCSGPVDGKTVGYAIFEAPGNLRYPTRWHARTYGLVGTNPFSEASFEKGAAKSDYTLDADKELTFRYRLYFHAGNEKDGKVAERYTDYADPPKATWK
jgi:hypothetical protein